MRIVHVSPTDIDGGAARGAYNLHRALRAAGVESQMLVQRKYGDDPSVFTHGKTDRVIYEGLRDRLDRLPLRLYNWRRENWWTVGWLPFDLGRELAAMRPDVVQFHWVGRGAAPINMIGRLGHYPIVWTLRDMWPLTGGCHYSEGCEKLYSGCGTCPQLGSKRNIDISRLQWRKKYRAWRNVDISYVALSNWMAECARRSPLTFGNEVSVIPNGIDLDRFKPIDKATARAIWGLPQDKRIIMFGAISGTADRRKGFAYLCDALRTLAARGWAERTIGVVFGTASEEPQVGIDLKFVGRLHDTVSLALLYACADVMVVPSTEENLGKTALEAMSCGVPIAAFANTGQFDIVDHKINGYLAKNLSAADLAQGIAWCLEQGEKSSALSHSARAKAVRCFDIRDVARQHVALYQRLIDRRKRVEDRKTERPHDNIASSVDAAALGMEDLVVPPRPVGAP